MTKQVTGYEYPVNGAYNETVAVFDDGTRATVCVQYAAVLPHGDHAGDCDQINKMGGRCTCGLLDGIDVAALLIDARKHGKTGYAPRPKAPVVVAPVAAAHGIGWCDKCQSYCFGDCEATK